MSTALYYPNIELDPDWLKVTLLYWDRVRRIFPAGAEWEINDSPDVSEALQAEALINSRPDDYRDAASERFKSKILPLLENGNDNADANSWIQRVGIELDTAALSRIHPEKMTAEMAERIQDYSRSLVHSAKVTGSLAKELEDRNLVTREREWLWVPELVAGLYMVCLGAEMSAQTGCPLLTDDAAFAPGGEYCLYGQPVSADDIAEKRSVLLRLGLRFPRPESLVDKPMAEILKFQKASTQERRFLRESLEAVAAKARQIDDPLAIEDFWSEERKKVDEAVREHDRRLDELRVSNAAWSLLKISIPSAITTFAGAAISCLDPSAVAATGLAAAGVVWWAGYRGKADHLAASFPWHYALRAARQFPDTSGRRQSLPPRA